MSKDFFIMMNHPNVRPFPMTEDDDSVAYFGSLEEAKKLADDHPWCSNFGYEIFELGRGEA